MIVASNKPVEEIKKTLEKYENILIAACGTCVTVCLSGGEKEANELRALLELSEKNKNFKVITPKRQCDIEFLEDFENEIKKADVVLSLACGAGVQFMAEKFTGKHIIPGLNTMFMGANENKGYWIEMCQGCGNCALERTGGVCPVTRCSKSNFNGPCGGSQDSKCEIDSETDCGWQLIYNRLKELDMMDRLYDFIEIRDWRTSRDGGPRKHIREDV